MSFVYYYFDYHLSFNWFETKTFKLIPDNISIENKFL